MSASDDIQTLKAVFGESWSEQDLQQVLQESRGDVDTATDRILSGQATKFGEVTKKKDKQAARKTTGTSSLFQPFLNADRGRGRGRGGASARGGRGDGRGRGRGRGGATGESRSSFSKKDNQASNTQVAPEEPVAVDTTSTWDVEPVAPSTDDWDMAHAPGQASADWDEPVTSVLDKQAQPIGTDSWLGTVDNSQQEASAKPKSRIIDKNSKSSWASIAKPVPAPQKPIVQDQVTPVTSASTAQSVPLTEENLEAATEHQSDLPQPPTATVRSMQGEAATGPSSIVGAPGTPGASIIPPGMKSVGQQRTGTPLGGRKLNQNQAVIMPGTESQPGTKLSLQFGSLDIEDEGDNGNASADYGKQVPSDQHRPQQGDKLYDNFGPGYGNYGMPAQPAGPYPGFGQGHAQYGGMSSFYGGQEPQRPSPFGDYYGQGQQQQLGSQPSHASPVPSGQASTAGTGARSGTDASRFQSGEQTGASPVASHISQQQGLAAPLAGATGSPAQHGVPQAYAGYPQGYQPNPYAYYGYGYPQQQPYGAYGQPSMYGQQSPQQQHQQGQRGSSGTYGASAQGYLGQQQGHAGSTHSLGTSQDRFERSTAEYQRQGNGSQQGQQQVSYGSHDDFLGGRSASQQHQQQQGHGNGSEDAYKGYGTSESTPSRDAAKLAQGYGGYPQQQQQQQQQYSNHAQYTQQQGQQTQYAQYGQYGARGGWNQQAY